MGSSQGDSQGWLRHWEVLDRVGLPDYTPDVLWQADVLQRAGVQLPRPPSSAADRRLIRAGSAGGSAAAGANSRTMQGGPTLPATASGYGANANSRGGIGGGVCLHPRVRPGLAKQPSGRNPQPRHLPLEAALNLQLVEDEELYGAVPYAQAQAQARAQEWSPPPPQSLSTEQPPPQPPPQQPPPQQQQQPQQQLPHGPPTLLVPRLELAAAGISGGSSSNSVGDGGGGGGGAGSQSSSTLPSLAQTQTGGGAQGLTTAAAAAAAPPVETASAASGTSAGGAGDALSRGGGSVVSFRIPLPAVPQTPTARSSPAAPIAPAAPGAYAASPLRKGSDRASAGGGGMVWGDAPGAGLEAEGSELAEQERPSPTQQVQQPTAWRPAAGAGGSGDLSARLPPSRKSSAGLPYAQHSYQPSYMTQRPQLPAQQQWPPPQQGKSLSGEASTVIRYGNSVQSATAVAASTATPRQRYKGILERVGRAAAHKQHERRRPGLITAAAGLHLRWQDLVEASESDAEADSDGGGSGGGSGGGGGGGSGGASPQGCSSGLGRWGARYYRPLAVLNEETGVGQEDVVQAATTSISGEPSSGAAAGSPALAGEPSRPTGAPASGSDPAQQAGPAVEDSQATAAGGGAGAAGRGEAAARRLGVAERAVWQLRRALDELARFSCAHAVRQGQVEEGSVLAQVDVRILALRRYEKVELGPDGRRASVIPPPPPSFPLEAARDYLSSAQSGVAGLEKLEEAVASMRRKLQIVVGQDTEDLRKAAAEALADAWPGAAGAAVVPEPIPAPSDSGQAPQYPIRRPSSGLTLGAGASYSAPSTYRLHSAGTTVSGFDPAAAAAAAAAAAGPVSYRSPPSSPLPPQPQPPLTSRAWTGNRRSGSGAAATATERLGSQRPSGPGLDAAWRQFESLVIQLHDSHASRVEMMDAYDTRPTAGANEPGGIGTSIRGGAAAALLAAAGGSAPQSGGARGRRAGGVDRLARLVDALDASGAAAGMAEAKEAATEAAMHNNAVRAAVAATLEPKHTEQALYFLAHLALMLQQDPRLPPDAGFLVAAGVDLLLGEVAWVLALLRASSGAGSPHLAVLAAALRAYEMQRSYTLTLRAVAERLELAAEEAMDKSTLLERQLSAAHSALQKAGHQVTELESNLREMERDMRKLQARNALLEETVADLENDMERMDAAHAGREATLERAERLAGALREEQLVRVRARSRATQVASEGNCSDPRAIPPALQPDASQYYPISPCVSNRNLLSPPGKDTDADDAGGGASMSRSGSKKHLRKNRSLRKGASRTTSRRGPRASGNAASDTDSAAGGGGSAAAAAAEAAAALAAARAAAEGTDEEDSDAAARRDDGDGDAARAYDSSSRLAARRRGTGLRTVSWVDRSSGCESPDSRRASGPADPAGVAGEESPRQRSEASGGEGGREAARSPRGPVGPAGGARHARERGRREGSPSRSPSPSSGHPRAGRGRPLSKAKAHGQAPEFQQQQDRQVAPPPGSESQPASEQDKEREQEREQEGGQEGEREQQPLLQGTEGVVYWAPQVDDAGGGGRDSSASGDGGGAARRPPAVVQDAALEQAARDMFSDVFVRQPSSGPAGRPGG